MRRQSILLKVNICIVLCLILFYFVPTIIQDILAPQKLEVVYAQDPLPSFWRGGKRIFLAGPTSKPLIKEGKTVERRTQWRVELIEELNLLGFKGYVYVPEFKNGRWSEWKKKLHPSVDPDRLIVEWEHKALDNATLRVFWLPLVLPLPDNPGDIQEGRTTRLELGLWLGLSPKQTLIGHPKGAAVTAPILFYSEERGAKILKDSSLKEVARAIMDY